MHWWQILIRLVLIANVWGNISDAIRANRDHHRERLQWLIPNAIGWAILFFGLLPVRWGGVGLSHWQIVCWISIVLLMYGMIIKITDVSQPALLMVSIEVPHFGSFGLQHLVPIAVFGFLLVGWDIFQRHRVTSKDVVLLIGFSMGLVFGVRIYLRQFSLTRLSDLIALMKPKPRPQKKQPEKYWMGEEK